VEEHFFFLIMIIHGLKKLKVADVFAVEMYGHDGIRWDALDIDLGIDSLIHLEKYPLTYH
jgi:hypothetical protein